MRVGFIGIGNMGWPMAAQLAKGGCQLTIYDVNESQSARFAAAHPCRVAARPAELSGAEFIITMLPNGEIVRDLYTTAPGALAEHLARGTVAIDMSSSDPMGTRALGETLAARGIILIDAPVSGAVPRARTATLTIMVGGNDHPAIERAKPLLLMMGNRVFETGALGCGHAMKALNNFVAASGYTAAAEALLVAQRFGLEPAKLIEILNVSTGRNFITETVMTEHVIGRQFATGFALGLLAKDVRIAADLARAVRLDAPLTRLVAERWALARERLGATRDNSEAILSWDESLAE